jgi:hypothetical protein
MDIGRSLDILAAGFKAACERTFGRKAGDMANYPHDFDALYSRSEDDLFALYTAIKNGNASEIRNRAGKVIVIMSEIVTQAESALKEEVPDEVARH